MDDTFIRACYGRPVDHVPVWFMRQAGRSLPGYRELRKKYDLLTLTRQPELAAEISLEPVRLLGVDAAILFADIMLLPIAMGIDVSIVDKLGPVIGHPFAGKADLRMFKPFEPESAAYLQKTIKILRHELKVPLIGFSAAPFTLASYIIEGEPTRTWAKTKRLMLLQHETWHLLMELLSDAIIGYLTMQVSAGAQAVQLFDSWVGCLSPDDYRHMVLPYVQRIFTALNDLSVPRIHFGTNTGAMLNDFANVECEVIGLDWRIDISRAKKIVGDKAVQGNLDPSVLLADLPVVRAKVDRIFEDLQSKFGYIFNLGHGVLPETDDRKLSALVEYVHGK